jgi:hypothetical protein
MSDVEYRVAGVLPSAKALQAVIDRLEVAGLDRAQFGVLASRAALFGHGHYETADELAADPSTPTAAVQGMESRGALTGTLIGGLSYVGATAATAGVILTGGGLGLAMAATLAAGGASGLAGALVAHGFGQSHASMIHDQLAGGGIVLWIRPRDDQQERAVVSELKGAGATKIVVQGRKDRSPTPGV